ncbi:hypothetical protein I0C86_20885 [Plantactinospora sp. S1510]|uniref:Uncharacterized protein n=1 Tax=Plantactinospora alkalitolerans TaxID=2789879 RepID=A0ABS0GYV4_9ACTN|nr:hypothetical protein [Plantactinospora alkalitolerans]MBF9131398.1 hypothetical protein [Plantactinospora alkalitolerans]
MRADAYLEQTLTDVTVPHSNLFVDPTGAEPGEEQRQTTDVSRAAMSRLRTPFEVEDPDREPQRGE